MVTSRLERTTIFLFLTPALLILLTFTILPAVWAIYVSFTDRALTGVKAVEWGVVGLRNYARLLGDSSFHHSIRLTLLYTLLTNLGQFTIGLSAALLLSRRALPGKTLLLTAIVLPMAIPGLIQALMWSSMLATGEYGTLNRLLGLFGVDPVTWLRSAPLWAIVLVNFWNNSGFAALLFLAGLENIPRDVEEAAHMDGASPWQMLWQIKLPLIRFVVLLWLLLNTLGCLGVFDLVFALTRGGPGNATELVGLFIYNQSFKYFELGYGSAASVMLLGISLVLGVIYVRLLRVDF
ncbi:MAG: Inner rane transporter permease protein YcjO [Chloroflexota bacterium]